MIIIKFIIIFLIAAIISSTITGFILKFKKQDHNGRIDENN